MLALRRRGFAGLLVFGPALRRRRLPKRLLVHRASQWTAEAIRTETVVSYGPQVAHGRFAAMAFQLINFILPNFKYFQTFIRVLGTVMSHVCSARGVDPSFSLKASKTGFFLTANRIRAV